MKDELNAYVKSISAVYTARIEEYLAMNARLKAEQEYRALRVLFFCHHGKFPDEI